jgi:hypothetical protein
MNRVLVLFSMLALLSGALPAGAADGGQAYDAVSKFMPTTDVTTVEPGDFATDYATASKVPDQPAHGGLFGHIQNQIAAAGGMMASLRNGMAEQVYVAGTKERTDYPALQHAEILDCGARTITELDLKAKTYTVTSLDAPVTHGAASGGHAAPGPSATDDGSKLAITIANRALGAKQVSGVATQGYASDITIVTTKPGTDGSTSKLNIKEYISKMPRVWLACNSSGHSSADSMPGAGVMSQYSAIMAAMATSKNSRFSFNSSGPAFPAAQLPLFEAVSFSGVRGTDRSASGQNGQLTIVTERGNVRSIGASDPVFSVPADFTKTN